MQLSMERSLMGYERITIESVPWPRMGLLMFLDFCQLPPWGLRVTAEELRDG